MTIYELIEICKEYDHLHFDIKTIEKNIEGYGDCADLEWATKRDKQKLLLKTERQNFIIKTLKDIGIEF